MTDKRCYSTASLILFEKIALFICAKRNFGWLYLKVARQPPVCRANGCLSESEQRVILGRELVDLAKYFQCFGRDFVLAVSQRVTGDLDQMRVGAAEAATDVGQGRKAINGQDGHYVLLDRLTENDIVVVDPNPISAVDGGFRKIKRDWFEKHFWDVNRGGKVVGRWALAIPAI